jgi:hypothetical protein
MLECRNSFRYQPLNEDLQVLFHRNSSFGWVRDISTVGLSFDYLPNINSPSIEKITIVSEGNIPFFLPQIPCKTIYDIHFNDALVPYSPVVFRRHGIEFVSPTGAQMKRIGQLLNCLENSYSQLSVKEPRTVGTNSKLL